MDNPSITIITICYNSAKTIRDTFNSMLMQSYKHYEYIVVDGGSCDGTIDIVREYEKRFEGRMHWISERDGGIFDAINKGIHLANGSIIGILHSDDLYAYSGVLADVADALSSTSADVVYGNIYCVDRNDTSRVIRNYRTSAYYPGAFRRQFQPPHPGMFVRKQVYEKNGLFDLSFPSAADFELTLRIFELGGISSVYLDKYLVRMRLGGTSSKNLLHIIKGEKETLGAWKKLGLNHGFFYEPARVLKKILQLF